ncbi:MAG: hypothetical protein IPO24_18410 [Bacteroidetes bacterium]|nr:hypothetical protein [Bacteroidota bacterium]
MRLEFIAFHVIREHHYQFGRTEDGLKKFVLVCFEQLQEEINKPEDLNPFTGYMMREKF